MEVRVYNRNLYRLGTVENQTSLIWTRRFFKPGEFELHAPNTEKNHELFARGNLVSMKGAVEAGIVEDLEKEESDLKNEMTVKGRFLSSYMDRRTIKTVFTFSGKIEEAMFKLYAACTAIPNVQTADLKGFDDTISFQTSYKQLDVMEQKLSQQGLIGIRFRPDFDNHVIIFETFKGVDHSRSQSKNKRVIFSEDYNNLSNAIYKINDQSLKTCAIVGGSGEGTDRTLVTVGGGDGLDLREVFVDARDLTKEEGMTDAEYTALLKQRGQDALNGATLSESLECETEPSINFTYKEDYDLGDIVTVRKKNWGLYMDQRITELQEVYEYGGGYVVPTLGSPLPETIDWSDK